MPYARTTVALFGFAAITGAAAAQEAQKAALPDTTPCPEAIGGTATCYTSRHETGAYITAAYWFTASTSFANPAVTLGRCLTDTFAGIRPADVAVHIGDTQFPNGTASGGSKTTGSITPAARLTPAIGTMSRMKLNLRLSYSVAFQAFDAET